MGDKKLGKTVVSSTGENSSLPMPAWLISKRCVLRPFVQEPFEDLKIEITLRINGPNLSNEMITTSGLVFIDLMGASAVNMTSSR